MKNRTYRYYQGHTLYPFGYGLSYTKFAYSDLKVSPGAAQAAGPVSVAVTVKNSGSVKGDEVVELYLTAPGESVAPIHALKGFKRVSLDPGASTKVEFMLDARALSSVAADGKRAVVPGKYHLSVGGSQPVEAGKVLEADFQITGTEALPR